MKIIMIVLCAAVGGALAFLLIGFALGPTHNIGQLMGQLIAASAVALLVAIGGWYWRLR